MVVRVRRVVAAMYIQGFVDTLPRNAPVAAMTTLSAISFLGPNLSEKNPVGIENSRVQRVGMATIRPICWFVRLNSLFRSGKMVERMFPGAWIRMCVRTMMRRL